MDPRLQGSVPEPPESRAPLILRPLRERDFALLWTGTTISMLGDGIYLVAIAWQVYAISNAPTALGIVGVAWTVPMVVLLLFGGVLGDRFERRLLLIASDAVRAVAIGAIGALSLAGVLELWMIVALVALYGAGEALFAPAFQAIIPDVVERPLLVQANSLQQLTEPAAYRFVGPALGGALIAWLGPGPAFLADAGTFAFSAACATLMRVRRTQPESQGGSVLGELREGFAYVRSQAWLWATLLAAALALLLTMGPLEVLLPYLVKNTLDAGAGGLGIVFAAAGGGAIVSGILIGQRGMGRRHVLWMYFGWAVAVGCIAFYALAATIWEAVLIGLVEGAAMTVGNVIWGTLVHTHVPSRILGRVSGFDWFVSMGLTPVSFALTGPAAGALGVEATMIGAGVLGVASILAFLLVPGLRDPERAAASASSA